MSLRRFFHSFLWLLGFIWIGFSSWFCGPSVNNVPDSGYICTQDDDCEWGQICRTNMCVVARPPEGTSWPDSANEPSTEHRDAAVSEHSIKEGVCSVGEQRACSRFPHSVTTGRCRKGIQKCIHGMWGPCEGEIGPTEEVCNNEDDDCDGKVDNIKGVQKPLLRTCKSVCGEGQESCFAGEWQRCSAPVPTVEICNGKDDDCDGKIDNHLESPLCRLQKGVCRGTRQICGGQKGWLPCSVAQYTQKSAGLYQVKETQCDGRDNDCDGITDPTPPCSCRESSIRDCFEHKQGNPGKGICKTGKQSCSSGAWGVCKGAVYPQPEICNNIDDNCDGKVDGIQRPCTTPCGSGVKSCEKGQWGVCKGPLPKQEICNGKDDDCDGKVDNIVHTTQPIQKACSTQCGKGYSRCLSGRWQRCSAPTPQSEVCNGKDDDCDGKVDNLIRTTQPLHRPCSTSCGKGKELCFSGRWKRCSAPTPQNEVCNGKDDDCNGTIDDGLKRTCTGVCQVGTESCLSGIWKGCKVQAPRLEICNGKDDDCNGKVDEDCYQMRTTPTLKGRGFLPVSTTSGSHAAVLTQEGQVHYVRIQDGKLLWTHQHQGLASGLTLTPEGYRVTPIPGPMIGILGVQNGSAFVWMYHQKEKKTLWKMLYVSKSSQTGNLSFTSSSKVPQLYLTDVSGRKVGLSSVATGQGKTGLKTLWKTLSTVSKNACSPGRMALDSMGLLLACLNYVWWTPRANVLQPIPSVASQIKLSLPIPSLVHWSGSSTVHPSPVKRVGTVVDTITGSFQKHMYSFSTVLRSSSTGGSTSWGGLMIDYRPPQVQYKKWFALPSLPGRISRPIGIRVTSDGYAIVTVQDFSTQSPYAPQGGRILVLSLHQAFNGKLHIRQTFTLVDTPYFVTLSASGKQAVVAVQKGLSSALVILKR